MKNKSIAFALFTMTGLTLSGCDVSETGANYSGLTTPIEISSSNGENVAVGAVNGQDSRGLENFTGVQTEAGESAHKNTLARKLANIVTDIRRADAENDTMFGGIAEAIAGTCGGTLSTTYSESYAELSFSNFCNTSATHNTDGLTFNGYIKAYDNGSNDTAFKFIIDFPAFAVKGTIDNSPVDVVMSGNMDIVFDLNTWNMTTVMNTVSEDKVAAEQVKVENFSIAVEDFSYYTLGGRVYISTLGYVDISTIAPLLMSSLDSQAISGELKFSGANGSYVILTATGGGAYSLTTNDGTTETNVTGDWFELGITAL